MFADGALAGRVALITGGGTGLGRAAALEVARCGASVVIAGRRADVLEHASAELGERCSWVAADIRESDGARMIVSSALKRHGRVDLLLNNAGGQYFVPAERITSNGWRAVQRLNVTGTLAMSEAAHDLAMKPARAGMIVNVTVSPHHGMPAMAHTGAARAAVEAFTREFAARWAPDGVSVAAIALGRFASGSLRRYPAELSRDFATSVPLQRLGLPREYGWLVALLASPFGNAFSGSVVTLDGALDNWSGNWRPDELIRNGEVPSARQPPEPQA